MNKFIKKLVDELSPSEEELNFVGIESKESMDAPEDEFNEESYNLAKKLILDVRGS